MNFLRNYKIIFEKSEKFISDAIGSPPLKTGQEALTEEIGEYFVENLVGVTRGVGEGMDTVGTELLEIGDVALGILPDGSIVGAVLCVETIEIVGRTGSIAVGNIDVVPGVEEWEVVVTGYPLAEGGDGRAARRIAESTGVLEVATDADHHLRAALTDEAIEIVESTDEGGAVGARPIDVVVVLRRLVDNRCAVVVAMVDNHGIDVGQSGQQEGLVGVLLPPPHLRGGNVATLLPCLEESFDLALRCAERKPAVIANLCICIGQAEERTSHSMVDAIHIELATSIAGIGASVGYGSAQPKHLISARQLPYGIVVALFAHTATGKEEQ